MQACRRVSGTAAAIQYNAGENSRRLAAFCRSSRYSVGPSIRTFRGLVCIRVGDTVYDGLLRARLKQLRSRKSARGAYMRFKADEGRPVLQERLKTFAARSRPAKSARALEVGDGIAHCLRAMSGGMAGELVDFPSRECSGLVFNLEETSVGVIIARRLPENQPKEMEVKQRRDNCSPCPSIRPSVVGPRGVDPLGNPLDRRRRSTSPAEATVESNPRAPGVCRSAACWQPLQPGSRPIDAMAGLLRPISQRPAHRRPQDRLDAPRLQPPVINRHEDFGPHVCVGTV